MNDIEALFQMLDDHTQAHRELAKEMLTALNADAVTADLSGRFMQYCCESRKISLALCAAVKARAGVSQST